MNSPAEHDEIGRWEWVWNLSGSIQNLFRLLCIVIGVVVLWGCASRRVDPMDGAISTSVASEVDRFEFSRPMMGVVGRVILYASDSERAAHAGEAALDRIASLERVMSDYDPQSEVNRWFARKEFSPDGPRMSRDLRSIIRRSIACSRATDGAFDVTVGPISRIWREARRTGVIPSDSEIQSARRRVGYQLLVEVSPIGWVGQVGGMQLDFGGIGKGWACDEAMKVLREDFGYEMALVELGGDLVVGNSPPGRDGWHVEVRFADGAGESRVLTLSNCGIATSGDTAQFMLIDGERWSHIIDPRTGYPLKNSRGVSVVAPEGATADALASAFSVLGEARAQTIVRRFEGVRFFVQ